MTKSVALGGEGEHSVHVFSAGPELGSLVAGQDYLSIEACSWFVHREDGWFRRWTMSGLIDATLGPSVERYQVALGTYELNGGARIAPVFDRPIVHDRAYRGGPLTFSASLFGAARDSALTSVLRGASQASRGIAAAMVVTASPGGPVRALASASSSLISTVTSLLGQHEAVLRPLFSREGLEVTLQPERLRSKSTYVLFHRGSAPDRSALQIESAEQGCAVPLASGRPLEDGAWLLLRVQRGVSYRGHREWFDQERVLRLAVDGLLAEVQANLVSPGEALSRLQAGSGGLETEFDRFRALRQIIQNDGTLTEGEARARIQSLAAYLATARQTLRADTRSLPARVAVRGAEAAKAPNPTSTVLEGGTEVVDADLRTAASWRDQRMGSPRMSRDHVLLIGIDGYRGAPLHGCVNDILAVRELLEGRFGVSRSDIAVLASPTEGRVVEGARPATVESIRRELTLLASPAVASGDRVIVYYSGHGGTRSIPGAGLNRLVECLVPIDFSPFKSGPLLYDAEINRRLAEIAQRTSNVTVILDCCHSAGATRGDLIMRGATVRCMNLADLAPPASAAELDGELAVLRGSTRSLTESRSQVMIVAACLADESASETSDDADVCHGILTRALLTALRHNLNPRITWREIWTSILAAARPVQNPTVFGDDRRVVFGDLAIGEPSELPVTPDGDEYAIAAGTLVDVSVGTQIAVYYADLPASPVHAPGDGGVRLATLTVTSASPANARARADRRFPWPRNACCRVATFAAPVLTVRFDAELPSAVFDAIARDSSLLVTKDERCDVLAVRDKGQWVLCDDIHGLARDGRPELVRCGTEALPAVLAHYVRYRTPLRLAARSTDLPGALKLRLLDAAAVPANPQLPDLPEIEGRHGFRYWLRIHQPFCMTVENHSATALRSVAVLNCGTSGKVQHLAQFVLPARGCHALWDDEQLGRAFQLDGPPGVERLVVIGSTKPDLDWSFLVAEESFAQPCRRTRDFGRPPQRDLYTATTLAVRVVD